MTTPTRVERFYRWLDEPTRLERRAAERDTARQAERWLRRQHRNPRRVARGRAACDAVTLGCLAAMLLVLALSGPDEPNRAPNPGPSVVVEQAPRQDV